MHVYLNHVTILHNQMSTFTKFRSHMTYGVLRSVTVVMADDELVMMLSPCKDVTPVGKVIRDHRKTVPREKVNHSETQRLY